MAKDLNKPLSKKELEKLQKKLKGGSPGQVWKKAASGNRSKLLAHGKFFDEDGRITRQDPSVGLTPSGKKIKMPVDKKKQKKNKAKHDRLYHGS